MNLNELLLIRHCLNVPRCINNTIRKLAQETVCFIFARFFSSVKGILKKFAHESNNSFLHKCVFSRCVASQLTNSRLTLLYQRHYWVFHTVDGTYHYAVVRCVYAEIGSICIKTHFIAYNSCIYLFG